MTQILLITGDTLVEDAVRSAIPDAQLRVFPRLGVAARVTAFNDIPLIVIGHDQLTAAATIGRIDGTDAALAVAFTSPPTGWQVTLADIAGATRNLVLPANPDDLEWLHDHAATAP
jgi:hypothetical protein